MKLLPTKTRKVREPCHHCSNLFAAEKQISVPATLTSTHQPKRMPQGNANMHAENFIVSERILHIHILRNDIDKSNTSNVYSDIQTIRATTLDTNSI